MHWCGSDASVRWACAKYLRAAGLRVLSERSGGVGESYTGCVRAACLR